jgi:putative membrane protein
MKYHLTLSDKQLLDKRIAEVEAETGTQIVLATAKRCDSYAEIPWKAFSLGASLWALMVIASFFVVPVWITDYAIIFAVTSILGGGIIFAVLTVLFPGFARLFLSTHSKETETMQYAEALFLSRELFATIERKGILLFVSQFERQVVILPDKGVKDLISANKTKDIISKMAKKLRKNDLNTALEIGLEEIRTYLSSAKSTISNSNELSNEIIEEE